MDEQERELERQAQNGDTAARERVAADLLRRSRGYMALWNVPPAEAPPEIGETVVGLSIGAKQEGRSWPMVGFPVTCMSDLSYVLGFAGSLRELFLVDLESKRGFSIQARPYIATVEPRPTSHQMPTIDRNFPYQLANVLNLGRGMHDFAALPVAGITPAPVDYRQHIPAHGLDEWSRRDPSPSTGIGVLGVLGAIGRSERELEDELEQTIPPGLVDEIVRSIHEGTSQGLSDEALTMRGMQALVARASDPAAVTFIGRLGDMAGRDPNTMLRFVNILQRRGEEFEARQEASGALRNLDEAIALSAQLAPQTSGVSVVSEALSLYPAPVDRPCGRCRGGGQVRDCSYDWGDPTWSDCPNCAGSGKCDQCANPLLKGTHCCSPDEARKS